METQENRLRSWLSDKRNTAIRAFRKEFLSEKPGQVFKNLGLVVVGNILLAFAAAIFLIPCDIVSGGTSGIALVIARFAELYGVTLNVNLIITLLTVFFFLLGLFIVGIGFTLKTLISTIVYPLFIFLFDLLRNVQALSWLRIETYMGSGGQTEQLAVMILAGVFGGIITGLAVSLAFKGGGSTGGTDCIVIALDRKTPLKASTISIIVDSLIILSGMLVYRDLIIGLVGIMTAITCAVMIDKVFVGSNGTYSATIVSARWQEISAAINKDMERGTTIYSATGGYTGAERKVVAVSFSRSEYRDFMRIIESTDPAAFVTVQTAYEVQGYGFSYDDGDDPIPIKARHSRKETLKAEKKALRETEKLLESKERSLKKDLKEVRREEAKEARSGHRESKPVAGSDQPDPTAENDKPTD